MSSVGSSCVSATNVQLSGICVCVCVCVCVDFPPPNLCQILFSFSCVYACYCISFVFSTPVNEMLALKQWLVLCFLGVWGKHRIDCWVRLRNISFYLKHGSANGSEKHTYWFRKKLQGLQMCHRCFLLSEMPYHMLTNFRSNIKEFVGHIFRSRRELLKLFKCIIIYCMQAVYLPGIGN